MLFKKFVVAGLAAGLLAGCAQVGRLPTEVSASDDDAACRGRGNAPGSDGYALCLKDLDAARGQQQSRMDAAHRRLSEDMLNRR